MADQEAAKTLVQGVLDFILLSDWRRHRAEAKARAKPETAGLVVKENLEAFLFAVVLVVIVRHFSLTPFRIPSSSMEPTLLGHEGHNDRLFVNRWIYTFQRPRRWDVVVFLYPLNQDKHFIKRLIGLPGEEISIADGDVYIDGQIARKPARVQEALWLAVNHLTEERHFQAWEHQAGRAVHRGDGRVTLTPSGKNPAWLRFGKAPRASETPSDPTAPDRFGLFYYRPSSPEPYEPPRERHSRVVGDVRVRARVAATSGRVLAEIVSQEDRFRLELAVGGGKSRFTHHEGESLRAEKPIPAGLAAGREHELVFWHADRRVRASLDGQALFEYDHALPLSQVRVETTRAEAALGTEGGELALSRVRLDRDVYYTNEGVLRRGEGEPPRFQIPRDHCFMLGDNSSSSSDSRLWTIVRATLRDGRVVNREAMPGGDRLGTRQEPPDGTLRLLDEYGAWQVVDRDDIASQGTYGPPPERELSELPPYRGVDPLYQCVRRDLVIGRAFFIFWPPRRLGFIR